MTRTLVDIVSGSRLIPFDEGEIRWALDNVEVRRRKGTDLNIGHPTLSVGANGFLEAARQGIVFLQSTDQLKAAFVFLKLDAGRGFLGGQKAVFASYFAEDIEADDWEVGTVFKMWGIATTSIGNIYRFYGFH